MPGKKLCRDYSNEAAPRDSIAFTVRATYPHGKPVVELALSLSVRDADVVANQMIQEKSILTEFVIADSPT